MGHLAQWRINDTHDTVSWVAMLSWRRVDMLRYQATTVPHLALHHFHLANSLQLPRHNLLQLTTIALPFLPAPVPALIAANSLHSLRLLQHLHLNTGHADRPAARWR